MARTLRMTMESLGAVGALVAILFGLSQIDDITPWFWGSLGAAATLFVACYLAPDIMTRLISMPAAFRIDQNLGQRGMAMQIVTYASYHTRWLAHATHTGLFVDAAAWLILASAMGGTTGLVVILAVVLLQAWSYRDRIIGVVVVGMWAVATAVATGVIAWLGGDEATIVAMTAVVATAVWRVVGHVTEPVPPGVSGSSRFVALEDMGFTPSLGLSGVVGYVAEFASGLPFRLPSVWGYEAAIWLGVRPGRLPDRGEVDRQRAAIFTGGWGAAPATAHLARPEARRLSESTPIDTHRDLPPYPIGWYAVAFSDQVAPGDVVSATVCGREMVVYRTMAGRAVAMDAHCPHMGAHLGMGGRVEDSAIRCPFHGFAFDAEGACVATGYGTKPPSRLCASTWQVEETDGVIMVWFHPAGDPASFSLPRREAAGWTGLRHRTFTLRDHPQETTENSVDLGHFGVVHGYDAVEILEPVEVEGAVLTIRYAAVRTMPFLGTVLPPVRFEFAPLITGLGHSMVMVSLPDLGLQARLLVLATPTDGRHVELRLGLRLARLSDRSALHPVTRLLPLRLLEAVASRQILAGFTQDAFADFPIWENKRYVQSPTLASGDGPIGVYRIWARQFYPTQDIPTMPDEIEERLAPVDSLVD